MGATLLVTADDRTLPDCPLSPSATGLKKNRDSPVPQKRFTKSSNIRICQSTGTSEQIAVSRTDFEETLRVDEEAEPEQHLRPRVFVPEVDAYAAHVAELTDLD